MPDELRAVLLDVGATLWPLRWQRRSTDEREVASRVIGVLDRLSFAAAMELMGRCEEKLVAQGPRDAPDAVIGSVLGSMGLPDDAVTARMVRAAMCLPAFGRIEPEPGARELLAAAAAMGLPCVVVSNTRLRDRAGYRQDFVALDLDRYITEYVTSVEVGVRKPDPAMFDAAARAAGVAASGCLMVGDHLEDDIVSALALGMRALLVNVHGYAEPDVPPAASVVASLTGAAAALGAIARDETVRAFASAPA
jgi:HAD superfamily hydrolase (TIGR01509 family)